MTRSRFPSPWAITDIGAAFVVEDARGQRLAHFYYEDEAGRRSAARLLNRDGARRLARGFARLPGLMAAEKNERQVTGWLGPP